MNLRKALYRQLRGRPQAGLSGLTLMATLWLLFAAATAAAGSLSVEAEIINYKLQGGGISAEGAVTLSYGQAEVRADSLQYDPGSGMVTAEGGVELRYEGRHLRGSRLVYDVNRGSGLLFDGSGREQGVFFRGQRFEFDSQRLRIEKGSFTTCDLEEPHYRLTARRISYFPDGRVVASNVSLFLGRHRIFLLPFLSWSLAEDDDLDLFSLPSISRNDYYGWHLQLAFAQPLDSRTHLSANLKVGSRIGGNLRLVSRQPDYRLSALIDTSRQIEDEPGYRYSLLPSIAVSSSDLALPGGWKLVAEGDCALVTEMPGDVSRLRYGFGLEAESPDLLAGQRDRLNLSADWRQSWYGVGGSYSAAGIGIVYGRQLGDCSLDLKYRFSRPAGETPFIFDRLRAPHRLEAAFGSDIGRDWNLDLEVVFDLDEGAVWDKRISVGRYLHCLELRAVWQERGGYLGLEMNLIDL